MKKNNTRKHWIHLGIRIIYLYFTQKEKISDLVIKGYNTAAKFYDEAWTKHSRHLDDELLKLLDPAKNSVCVDLACGTGYVTGKLEEITKGKVLGVDRSSGMLEVAKKNYGSKCKFIQSDVLKFLKNQPDNSYDIVTYAWALCYSEPKKVIREIRRVLKPNGRLGIIDNTFFSVFEMFFAGISTVAEDPAMLKNLFNIHPLANKFSLYIKLRFNGMKVLKLWNGEKRSYVPSGKEAINKLIETGTASGYKYLVYDKYHTQVLRRYPINLERLYMTKDGIPITHRYIASIAQKK
jgi:ubiquinone/menaquinone biosynthesis C-methylase UbiE